MHYQGFNEVRENISPFIIFTKQSERGFYFALSKNVQIISSLDSLN